MVPVKGNVRIHIVVVAQAEALSQRVMIGCDAHVLQSWLAVLMDFGIQPPTRQCRIAVHFLAANRSDVAEDFVIGAILFDDEHHVVNARAGSAGGRNGEVIGPRLPRVRLEQSRYCE